MLGYNLEEQARLTRYQRAFLLRGVAYYSKQARQQRSTSSQEQSHTDGLIDSGLKARMQQRRAGRPRRNR